MLDDPEAAREIKDRLCIGPEWDWRAAEMLTHTDYLGDELDALATVIHPTDAITSSSDILPAHQSLVAPADKEKKSWQILPLDIVGFGWYHLRKERPCCCYKNILLKIN